jgi:hypothetical protein
MGDRSSCPSAWALESVRTRSTKRLEADTSRGRKANGKFTTWPEEEEITRPIREYLTALDQAAPEAAQSEDVDNDMPPGNAPATPKVTSLTDPAAAWTNKGQVKVGFAYSTNYLIDTRRAIILDVEATPATTALTYRGSTRARRV